jgi:hypothetical protein
MRRLLSILFVCSIALQLLAAVEFKASAPAEVEAGTPFRVTYSVNQPAKDLKAPDFANFECLTGPYTSQSSSTSIINGKRSTTFIQTFTYMLKGRKEGSYTIPPATIKIGGKQYTSNGLRVKVLAPNQKPTQPSEPKVQIEEQKAEVFVRTIVSNKRVHEQEAVLLTYKVYFSGCGISQFTNNIRFPECKGFLKQELEVGQVQADLETYNGKNYQTAVLYRALLFPQVTGDIVIDPAHFEAVVQVPNRAKVRSIFDDLYTSVVKPLDAPAVTVHVDPLPTGKPTAYSGAVGQYTIDSKISSTALKANEPVTLTLTIHGSGNMKLLKTPDVDWPDGFEVYDPKVTNDFQNSKSGTSGTKIIEYLAIPRAAGVYKIPPVEFSFYDTQTDTYRTLKTTDYTLNIARAKPGESVGTVVNNFVNKEDIKQLGNDIRYIHTADEPQAYVAPQLRYGSLFFWLCYLIPLLISVVLFVIFRKKIQENADIALVRYKKANKEAQRRLKTANNLLRENNKEAFYEEIERAAWTYLSDRLSIPTADLNKENISHILADKGVNEALIQEVNHVLSTAEFARYAPTSDHAMQDMYKDTTQMINNLESQKL